MVDGWRKGEGAGLVVGGFILTQRRRGRGENAEEKSETTKGHKEAPKESGAEMRMRAADAAARLWSKTQPQHGRL